MLEAGDSAMTSPFAVLKDTHCHGGVTLVVPPGHLNAL